MSDQKPTERALPLRIVHGLYAWPAFLLLALLSLPLLLVLPSLAARRRLIRGVARLALACIGLRLNCRGLKRLPLPCIVVANHESYLDGVILAATLPPVFGFVIKREMLGVPGAGWLLTRIGAQFVARNNGQGSARDALRVLRSASRGESLAFFPEGTFRHAAGLLPFHNGAFAAAQRAGLPVVPVVIRGTRRCLPPGLPLPRPGQVTVRALPALPHVAAQGVASLREAARAAILEASGLADLG